MSVIIKGATMPGTCVDCPLFRESAYGFDLCKGKGIGFVAEDAKWLDATRPDWCPMVELPEKHGRLGDLDELKTSLADSINECKKWIKELEENGDNETLVLANQAFCTFVEVALRLKSIPTIVEAEGE